jgi:hypothetical protein
MMLDKLSDEQIQKIKGSLELSLKIAEERKIHLQQNIDIFNAEIERRKKVS